MKKFFILLLVLIAVASNLYAGDDNASQSLAGNSLDSRTVYVKPIMIGSSSATSKLIPVNNPFSGIWGFYLQIVIGAIGGGLMLVRFATELVAAVIYEGEDSSSRVRKVIIRFLVHVGVAVLGFSTLKILLL